MCNLKYIFIFYIFLFSYAFLFSQIKTDANFENGNVSIIKINDTTQKIFFEPSLIDSNNTTRCWFYFKISGLDTSKNTVLAVKTKHFFIAPARPVFSYDNKKWNNLETDSISGKYRYYSHKFRSDSIWFATGYPYTYSRMLHYVDSLANIAYIDTATLCISEHGLRVPMLTISDTANRQMIWIIVRQHAFESLSNFFLEGILQFITDTTQISENYRKNFVTYIVPMMDVDNVWQGGSGRMQKPVDFNRDWTDSSYWNAVKSVKKQIKTTSQNHNFSVFLDIHSTFPGGLQPLTGIFDIYNAKDPQYSNIQRLINEYSQISEGKLTDINSKSFPQGNYADRYNSENYKKTPSADFLSATVECDWNYRNGDNAPIDTNILRENGYYFMNALVNVLKEK